MGISVIPFSFSEEIPDWVKHTAQWWADRKISQSDFTNALESLIKDGIIHIPPTEMAPPGPDKIIPDWVRNTAGWWADDYIPDSDFINAIQYLVSIGLIEVKVSTPEPVEEIVEIKKSVPLMLLVEGYDTVTPEKKFVLDVLVFDAEKYPQASPTFNRNADYTVDGVNVEIELYNEEGQIHTFSGTTKDGFLRYEILARETSQDGTLWMINNLYTVDVSVSLDGENTGKIHQFWGISNYDKGSASVASYLGQIIKTVEINDFTTNGPALFRSGQETNYGWSAANIGDLDGDGVNDLAVGHPIAIEGVQVTRGEFQIHYMNSDGTLKSNSHLNVQDANITLHNGARFGTALAGMGDIDGDGIPDLAVGAYMSDGNNRGEVKILFMDTDGSVSSVQRHDHVNGDVGSLDGGTRLGYSVENIGDLDGNGVNDVAMGGYMADETGTPSDSGLVIIGFLESDGSFGSIAKIKSTTTNGPSINGGDKYGTAIANVGDLDGDGVQEIAVGSSNNDEDSAEIHIHYMNTDGTIDSTVEINDNHITQLASGDAESLSLEGLGDIDGDGVGDLAIGLEKLDTTGTNRGGVVFAYLNSDGTIKSTLEFNDSTTNGPTLVNSDFFGSSVANMGDLDGYSKFNIVGTSFKGDWDGNDVVELAVGARGDDMASDGNDSSVHPNRGAVHLLFLE